MLFVQWFRQDSEIICRVVCETCWYDQPRIAIPRKMARSDIDAKWNAAHQRLQEIKQVGSFECPGCEQVKEAETDAKSRF